MSTCASTYHPQALHQPGTPPPPPIQCVREVDEDGRHRGDHQGWEPMPAGERDIRTMVAGAWVEVTETWEPWSRLWTWSTGGASGSSRKGPGYTCMGCAPNAHRRTHEPEDHALVTCASCGVLHDPAGHNRDYSINPEVPADWCFSCALWETRAIEYARQEVSHDRRRGMAGRWSRPVRVYPGSRMDSGRIYGWSHGHGGAFGGLQVTVTWDDGQAAGPADYLWDGGSIPWWMLDRFPPNAVVTTAPKVPRAGHTTGFNGHGTPLTYTAHPYVPED